MISPREIVADAVRDAVRDVADDPTNTVQRKDVAPVVNKVVKEVAPIVEHLSNTEPWYQSRVTWGAIGAVALPILGVLGVTADIIEPDEFVALGVAAGTVLSGLITLYGRYVARKPIGA